VNPRETSERPRRPGTDVLLISLDTLRSDAIGAYGDGAAETPWMDRLAAAGVRFAQARAHNVVTLPSHANLLSGRLPRAHGVRDNSGFRFPKDVPTLATILDAQGYRTAAFVSAFVLDARFGLDRGFDVYDDAVGGAQGREAFEVPERSATETVAAAVRWLEAGSEPAFLFVHIYEPHAPYEPPEPYRSRFRGSPYRGEVAAADAALAPLLQRLLEGQESRETLVVLTSDHGEGLGEHGEATHGVFAYESTLHVPLLLYAPGLLEPRTVDNAVRHIDVLPTVLDLLGIEPDSPLDGRSLVPLALGRELRGADTPFEALSAALDRGWAPLHGIVAGSLKYIDLPIPELYDLERDPAELTNLAEQRPKDLERLRALVLPSLTDGGELERVPEDSETLDRLRALGYMSANGSVERRYGSRDDPKQLIDLERREAQILRRFRAGDYDAARTLCLQSLKERPDMSLTWTQLATIERARGQLDAAVDAGRRALELRPLDTATAGLLGGTLVEAGQPEEARRVLAPFLASGDPDILNAEGMAWARLGQSDKALAVFESARRADPRNTMALVNAATIYLMTGKRSDAERAFRAALEIDPRAARAHNGLGVIAAQTGQPERAIEHWKQAVALDPRDYRGLFNLGATLRSVGREGEARPFLEAYLRAAPDMLEQRDRAHVQHWLGSPQR
jgi:arylsulfatase A-like enzyme/tetratricopeptide (TPR) repeat protein